MLGNIPTLPRETLISPVSSEADVDVSLEYGNKKGPQSKLYGP